MMEEMKCWETSEHIKMCNRCETQKMLSEFDLSLKKAFVTKDFLSFMLGAWVMVLIMGLIRLLGII